MGILGLCLDCVQHWCRVSEQSTALCISGHHNTLATILYPFSNTLNLRSNTLGSVVYLQDDKDTSGIWKSNVNPMKSSKCNNYNFHSHSRRCVWKCLEMMSLLSRPHCVEIGYTGYMNYNCLERNANVKKLNQSEPLAYIMGISYESLF